MAVISELFYLPAVVTDDVRERALLRDVLPLIREVEVYRDRA